MIAVVVARINKQEWKRKQEMKRGSSSKSEVESGEERGVGGKGGNVYIC